MSQIIAICYPDMNKAAEVMSMLPKLQVAHLLELEDACSVTKDETGKIKLHQAHNLTAAGAVGGAFWGTLLGMIFLTPLGGLALGAAAGALSGKISDYGINDEFMKTISAEMKPGSSALFMLVRKATGDKVAPEFAKFGGKILYTSMSKEEEARLNQLLAAGNAEAGA